MKRSWGKSISITVFDVDVEREKVKIRSLAKGMQERMAEYRKQEIIKMIKEINAKDPMS